MGLKDFSILVASSSIISIKSDQNGIERIYLREVYRYDSEMIKSDQNGIESVEFVISTLTDDVG